MSTETIWVKVRADLLDFNRKMQMMQQKMQKVGGQLKSVGSSMSLGLTAPIALFGAATLKAAGDFEAGMNKVKAVSGATGAEFEKLRNQAKQLGATTQFSASQSADAMGFLAMAGLEANEIYSAMPDTLNLAAAAQIEMGSAADIVTNILTGMQIPLEELPHAVDVMAKAFTSSNTDLQQLGQGMKFVGPVAGAFGVNIETTTAALGLLSNAGMQAGLAGTGFRKVLTKLVSSQKKLGVQTLDSSGKLLPLADILDALKKKGFDGAEAMEIFGDRGGPAMINLLSAGGDEIRRFTGLLDDAGGTADRIAKTQMMGLNGAMKELKSAFESFQIALGDSGLLEWVGGMAKGLAEFFRNLGQTNPAILRMATAVLAVVAAIGPLALIMGSVITAAGALAAPIGLAVAALAALAAGAVAVGMKSKEMSDVLAEEKAELNSLVGAITNANNSEETRKKLIEELNKKYPSFLENIDAEKVSNEQLVAALEDVNKEYDKKIINALKEEATDKLRTERIKLQLRELDLIKQVADAEAAGNNVRKAGATTGALGIDQTYESYQRLLRSLELNRSGQAALTEEIQNTIDKYNELGATTTETPAAAGGSGGGSGGGGGGGDAVTPTAGMKVLEAEAAGRILQLEMQRRDLQGDFLGLLRNAVAIRNEELALIDKQLSKAKQVAEDDPTDENLAKVVELNNAKLEAERRFSADITAIKDQNRKNSDAAADLDFEKYLARLEAKHQADLAAQEKEKEIQEARRLQAEAVGNAVQIAMVNLGQSISGGLTKAESGFKRFIGVMIQTVTKLIAMMLSSSIANAIQGATAAGAATGPAAIFTTPAFIATAVGGVMSAFAAIPKFAKGGLVGSPMMAMVGDNVNARHDPEVISPLSKLSKMMGGNGGSQELFVQLEGETIWLATEEYLRRTENSR
jgi:TP901 family phage tail tape measure protein